jgi:hypothetical protein
MRNLATLAVCAVLANACASLGSLATFVQAPRFEEASNRRAEVRVLPPSAGSPLGGASLRLWTKVTNPNPFGFTLSTLSGTLYLDEARAAATEFPLGLPLAAGGESVIPIDLAISFADLPQLADVIRRTVSREPIPYHFEGTVGVQAGRFGTPTFGPMTLFRGTVD